MYRIAVLTDRMNIGAGYADQVSRFCAEQGMFPEIAVYQETENFFEHFQELKPSSVLLALQGVAGLNAAEHLRSISPECGMIWCSDLDFSLHAFRIGAEYFFLEPVCDERLKEGLQVWMERRRFENGKNRYS